MKLGGLWVSGCSIEYRHHLLVAGYWLLVTGYWLLVTGCWSLVAGCWLLVAGHWLLDAGYRIPDAGFSIRQRKEHGAASIAHRAWHDILRAKFISSLLKKLCQNFGKHALRYFPTTQNAMPFARCAMLLALCSLRHALCR